MKLRKRTKRESIAYFQGYIDSANAAENWLRHHLAAEGHDIKALAKFLVGAATAGLSHVDIALLPTPAQGAPPATPAWTMQGCPECRGTGKEGTGTPSGAGGESTPEPP